MHEVKDAIWTVQARGVSSEGRFEERRDDPLLMIPRTPIDVRETQGRCAKPYRAGDACLTVCLRAPIAVDRVHGRVFLHWK